MSFRRQSPPAAPEPAPLEWQPAGLPGNSSTLEVSTDPDARPQYRASPPALADTMTAWVVDTPHAERAHWIDPMPHIAHVCTDSCAPACPDDELPARFPF
ncbi:hypothetical protein [Micromonospora tulbaghiae]|uniref:hypothetical protein n=1 Tax=Micromonospora tulbaghiae TaxID=479978 RepID=UPI003EC0D64C